MDNVVPLPEPDAAPETALEDCDGEKCAMADPGLTELSNRADRMLLEFPVVANDKGLF